MIQGDRSRPLATKPKLLCLDEPAAGFNPVEKQRLMDLEEGDILLHRFSPTGFYSSAVRNLFLRMLESRSQRQVPYSRVAAGEHTVQLDAGVKGKNFWVTPQDRERARSWVALGHTEALKTPDDLDKARPVYVVCASGNRSAAMTDLLRGSGYDAYSVAGGTAAWARSGRPVETGTPRQSFNAMDPSASLSAAALAAA